MKNKIKLRFGVLAGIVGFATLARVAAPSLLGHPSNFAPIGALALFSGCYFSGWFSKFFVPLLAVWAGDLVVNYMYTGHLMFFYQGFYWQYACYLLFVVMGSALSKQVKPLSVLGSSLAASCIFFLVSNLGVWVSTALYPHTTSGLTACYTAGIPFFGNTLAGDLFYTAAMFGIFELAKRKYSALALSPEA